MRIDWPRERAACGSFFDPNSTISTTATIRIFQGLSNRSPIMSVPHLAPETPSRPESTRQPRNRRFVLADGARQYDVVGQGTGTRVPDFGHQFGPRDSPPAPAQPH